MRFVCEACGWEGADPTFDAHLNAFCPKCARPAEFEEIARIRRERRRGPARP